MTPLEHELIMLMFARMNEAIATITDVLKSRGLLTEDDAKAFSHAVHYDETKTLPVVLQTWRDYLACAAQVGVATGLENGPPSKPNS